MRHPSLASCGWSFFIPVPGTISSQLSSSEVFREPYFDHKAVSGLAAVVHSGCMTLHQHDRSLETSHKVLACSHGKVGL